jgi:hypothetical protein
MQMVGGRGDAARTSQAVAEGGSQPIPAGRPDDEIPF